MTLITGANGNRPWIDNSNWYRKTVTYLALDLKPMDETLEPYYERFIQGDILDKMLLEG